MQACDVNWNSPFSNTSIITNQLSARLSRTLDLRVSTTLVYIQQAYR